MRYVLVISLFLIGCNSKTSEKSADAGLQCKGIYYEGDSSAGTLKKYNQYEQAGRCLTDNLPLSRFETTKMNWDKNNTKCTPQPGFPSRTLVSANNFYDYRDGKVLLKFDSGTGVFKRIILAEGRNGDQAYTKLQGCYYQRADQLLLDTDVNKIETSQYFDPMEIFTYTVSGQDVNMVRFDDTKDYDYRNCPYLNTPWKFCTALRDGNEMFFPILTAQQMTDLTNEAIIILRQFNWTTSNQDFDSLWDSIKDSRKEKSREDYLYDVVHVVDTPRFIDQAWRDYVMGNRPTMPDTSSQTSINVCYHGSKNVTLNDGSTGKVYGEICYVNGVYTFTQN